MSPPICTGLLPKPEPQHHSEPVVCTPHEVLPPVLTPRQAAVPILIGASWGLPDDPLPIWPLPLLPQHHSDLSKRVAHEWPPPESTVAQLDTDPTRAGRERVVVVPSPT